MKIALSAMLASVLVASVPAAAANSNQTNDEVLIASRPTPTANDFLVAIQEGHPEQSHAANWMEGVLDGFRTMKTYNDGECVYRAPGGRFLTIVEARDALKRLVQRVPRLGVQPAQDVLIMALRDDYPCD